MITAWDTLQNEKWRNEEKTLRRFIQKQNDSLESFRGVSFQVMTTPPLPAADMMTTPTHTRCGHL